MSSKVSFSIALIVFFWASSFVAIKVGLQDITPINLTLVRFIISSIGLGLIALIQRPKRILKKDQFRFVLAAVFGVALYNIALNYGQQTISAGSASFLINTVPIFTTILSFLILKEKLILRTVIGIAISMVGVGLITLSESQEFNLNQGIILLLIASFSQALFFIIQKPLLTRYSPLTVISYSVWLGTLFLLPFSKDLFEVTNASRESKLALLYLGIVVGALGHVIWAYVLSQLSASKATSFLYFVPVVSVVLSFLLVKEIPSLLLITGGLVAITGVYIVNKRNQ
ncbi:MAG: DMT family transporter [Fulvivirga sp.]